MRLQLQNPTLLFSATWSLGELAFLLSNFPWMFLSLIFIWLKYIAKEVCRGVSDRFSRFEAVVKDALLVPRM